MPAFYCEQCSRNVPRRACTRARAYRDPTHFLLWPAQESAADEGGGGKDTSEVYILVTVLEAPVEAFLSGSPTREFSVSEAAGADLDYELRLDGSSSRDPAYPAYPPTLAWRCAYAANVLEQYPSEPCEDFVLEQGGGSGARVVSSTAVAGALVSRPGSTALALPASVLATRTSSRYWWSGRALASPDWHGTGRRRRWLGHARTP